MKTPTEEIWPGVTQFPDYKGTFPNWTNYNLANQVKNMDEDGLDLLQQTLIYDPVQRISAKKMMQHPYFNDVDRSVTP